MKFLLGVLAGVMGVAVSVIIIGAYQAKKWGDWSE